MVRPTDHLQLLLSSARTSHESSLNDANQQDMPVTPMNRTFDLNGTDSFFTAIQSPNSDIVNAARARARSRSGNNALLLSQVSPVTKRDRDRAVPPTVHAYNTSFETSFDEGDGSLSMTMSNSFSDSNDTTQESFSVNADSSANWKCHLKEEQEEDCEDFREDFKLTEDFTGGSSAATNSTVSFITHHDHHLGRPKSHTISGMGLSPFYTHSSGQLGNGSFKSQQDVFGPTQNVFLTDSAYRRRSTSTAQPQGEKGWTGDIGLQTAGKWSKPRRLTVGGTMRVAPRGQPRAALHGSHRLSEHGAEGLRSSHERSRSAAASLALRETVSEDQSLSAFQKLIEAMKSNRSTRSAAIGEIAPVEPRSIGAVLDYRPCSPSGHGAEYGGGQKCELCGSLARRLTMLEPCGHLACALCCSSGLNQVTATPPRAHTCASCHSPVLGITLRQSKGRAMESSDRVGSGNTSSGKQKRATGEKTSPHLSSSRQTMPSPLLASSDMTSPTAKKSTRGNTRDQVARTAICTSSSTNQAPQPLSGGGSASEMMLGLLSSTSSSDMFTEDQSFYQSQRGVEQQKAKKGEGRGAALSITPTPEKGLQGESVRSTTPQGTSIVRVDNIPWTVSYKDVVEWLPHPAEDVLPDNDVSPAAVHVPIDVITGKTSNCCFIECRSKEAAQKLVRHRNNSRLLGRPVSLMVTTLSDLLNEVFPARTETPSPFDEGCQLFTPLQLQQLVNLLRNGGIQLKGPLKIVDMTSSMIRLVPGNTITSLGELLFKCAKEIVCICIAASQDMPSIRSSLDRLLTTCSNCVCFTDAQRIDIFDSARGTLTALTQAKELADSMVHRTLHSPLASPAPTYDWSQLVREMEMQRLTTAARAEAAQADYHARLLNSALLRQQQVNVYGGQSDMSFLEQLFASQM